MLIAREVLLEVLLLYVYGAKGKEKRRLAERMYVGAKLSPSATLE